MINQTISTLLEAMLRGLVHELQVTAAAVVAAHPDKPLQVVAQVGESTAETWQHLFDTARSDLFRVPLATTTTDYTEYLCLYQPDKVQWGRASRLSANAVAAGIEYLLTNPENKSDAAQLVASRRLLSVTEEELRRIVLDVHDGPVQKIYASTHKLVHVRAMLERASRDQQPLDEATILPDLIRSIEMLEISLQEIRTFLGAFPTTDMAQRNLVDILEGLILQHEQLSATTVHFEAPLLPDDIPLPVKIALYRILQESLANTHRHAEVNEVFVKVSVQSHTLTLSVLDFGKGFNPPELLGPQATEQAQHIGLRGIRERIQLVGGTLEVNSKMGEGTRIEVSVPIQSML